MLVHWIWYANCEMSDWVKAKLLRQFSDPEEIFYADGTMIDALPDLSPEAKSALWNKSLDDAHKILNTCRRDGIHILTLRDAAYPARLKQIPDPPVVLYYKGMLPDLDSTAVIGIVGTRKATGYGLQTASRLGYQIGCCGGIVVSGMAAGVDGAAMEGALRSGQSVIGVLGCGVDVVYPASNRSLYRNTERYGCLISQFAPGTKPAKWNFPRRNRIISGLSCGVLVVEAPEKSGALITARAALDQGRDVFVVPGNVDQESCAGSNRLLRDGAIPVSCGWDVVSEYETLYPEQLRQWEQPVQRVDISREADPEMPRPTGKNTAGKPDSRVLPKENDKKGIDKEQSAPYIDLNDILPKLSEEERVLVSALRDGERLVDDVIAETGLTTGKVLGLLTMLELKGILKRHPGKRISLK